MSRRLAALLALLLAAPAAAHPVVVEESINGRLVLPAPATRLVSLAPHITEMLFAIGAGELLVGADEYSDYPAAARAVPRVSNYAGANYEQIVALGTELVIGWQSGNGEPLVAPLRALGVPVFMVEARRLDDIPTALEYLGRLTGRDSAAGELAAALRQRLAALRTRYAGAAPVRYFYQIWDEPLITYNGDHLISSALAECGGVNIFAQAVPLVPYVSAEAVLVADPAVMISAGNSPDDNASTAAWQRWPSMAAVAGGHRYGVSADLTARHGPRFIDGVEQLCELLDRARR